MYIVWLQRAVNVLARIRVVYACFAGNNREIFELSLIGWITTHSSTLRTGCCCCCCGRCFGVVVMIVMIIVVTGRSSAEVLVLQVAAAYLASSSKTRSSATTSLMCKYIIQYIRLKHTKHTGNTIRLYLSMSDGVTPVNLIKFNQYPSFLFPPPCYFKSTLELLHAIQHKLIYFDKYDILTNMWIKSLISFFSFHSIKLQCGHTISYNVHIFINIYSNKSTLIYIYIYIY